MGCENIAHLPSKVQSFIVQQTRVLNLYYPESRWISRMAGTRPCYGRDESVYKWGSNLPQWSKIRLMRFRGHNVGLGLELVVDDEVYPDSTSHMGTAANSAKTWHPIRSGWFSEEKFLAIRWSTPRQLINPRQSSSHLTRCVHDI